MTEIFLTFQKFHDIQIANEVAERLRENNIDYSLEDNRGKFFDASFANNAIEPEIIIKLKSDDFSKAKTALEDYYGKQLVNVDRDYYLFDFSNEELMEIMAKPDEWGSFDYLLAQKILIDRGQELNPNTLKDFKEQRINELSTPEKASRIFIFVGYFFIVFGAVIGIIIGWHLYYSRKTLPNGESVFLYRAEDRKQGSRILFIATIVFVLAIILKIILLISGQDF